ncbi:MAG: 2'-5' RNA ligase family protein [Candidatus Micrarchaeota archaeon]|nr:2'-5' RNA ligase family protein [Candidatus Micrarchaeota archaeon]
MQKLYFGIVIQPGRRLDNEIMGIIRDVSRKYKTYSALKDKKRAHITLVYMNQLLTQKEVDGAIAELRVLLKKIKPFTVRIDGVRTFRKKYGRKVNYVVFLRPIPNNGMSMVHTSVRRIMSRYKATWFNRFVPHMALARTDVNRKQFLDILREYRNFSFKRSFRVTAINAMTRRGKNGNWKVVPMKLG